MKMLNKQFYCSAEDKHSATRKMNELTKCPNENENKNKKKTTITNASFWSLNEPQVATGQQASWGNLNDE